MTPYRSSADFGMRLRLFVAVWVCVATGCSAFIGYRFSLDLAAGTFTGWDLFVVLAILLWPFAAFLCWFISSEHRVLVGGGGYGYDIVDRHRFDTAGLHALRVIDRCLKRPRRRDHPHRPLLRRRVPPATRRRRGTSRAPRTQVGGRAGASRDGPRRNDDDPPDVAEVRP